ncbi:MAG: alpha/beta hydrolase [Chloroflexota bacterium]
MEEIVQINGRSIETIYHGPSPDQAPTLVFLHEGLGCAALWRDFPAKLAAATGCGALVYSRVGYGRSSPCDLPRPMSYMHDAAFDILPALLDHFAIQDCILVGHSDGGSIALIYAGGTAALPLCGIITEAAHVFCEDICISSVLDIRKAFLETDLRQKLTKYHGDNVDCAFWGWNETWARDEFRYWNIEEYLLKIRVPLLAIQGEDDNYGTVAQLDAIVDQTGGQRLLLPDCGHAPHRDQEEATLAAMTHFVQQIIGAKRDA